MNSKELSVEASTNPEILRNLEGNKEAIRCARPVSGLSGMWAGRAVICGAGPSLSRALPELRRTALPIIACDRAVKPLMAAGVRPKFVISVETHPEGARKMDGVYGLERIPLVFDPTCYPEIVDRYPGPLYTYNKPDVVMNKGRFRVWWGTGVITYAVGLADLLGADQVILSGVDLAYPGGKTHADGVNEIAGEVFEHFVKVPCVTGGEIASDVYLQANVEELRAATHEVDLVQTSPEGARIEGARHMTLEEALRE